MTLLLSANSVMKLVPVGSVAMQVYVTDTAASVKAVLSTDTATFVRVTVAIVQMATAYKVREFAYINANRIITVLNAIKTAQNDAIYVTKRLVFARYANLDRTETNVFLTAAQTVFLSTAWR